MLHQTTLGVCFVAVMLRAGAAPAAEAKLSLDEAIARLTEHTIRLEEQNKATQQQLALIERQMEKRFEMLQQNLEVRFAAIDKRFEVSQQSIDKRFEALQRNIDRRFDLMTWILGIAGSIVAAGVGYLISMSKNVVVMKERMEQMVEAERVTAIEKRVDAIQERLEEGGRKIILGS